MKLPAGITGFGCGPSDYGESDVLALKPLFFQAGSRVIDTKFPGPSRNFYRFDLELTRNFHTSRLSIVVNSSHPYLAATVTPAENDLDHAFIAIPTSIAGLLPERFIQCSPEWLAEPPVGDIIGGLSPAEKRELRYWKPSTVGEVIFNYYD